jgi:hypothetical protein
VVPTKLDEEIAEQLADPRQAFVWVQPNGADKEDEERDSMTIGNIGDKKPKNSNANNCHQYSKADPPRLELSFLRWKSSDTDHFPLAALTCRGGFCCCLTFKIHHSLRLLNAQIQRSRSPPRIDTTFVTNHFAAVEPHQSTAKH